MLSSLPFYTWKRKDCTWTRFHNGVEFCMHMQTQSSTGEAIIVIGWVCMV